MKRAFWVTPFLLLAAVTGVNAAEVRRFVDSDATPWTRQLITEKTRNGTLLLVVDSNVSRPFSEVRFRKLLRGGELSNLNRLLDYYRTDPRSMSHFRPSLTPSSKPLWTIKKTYWDMNDEKAYADWVNQNVNADFLEGSGITVDCAELALTARWVFARQQGLPAVNTLVTGQLFGQWMSTVEWDQLASDPDWHNDERFKAALRFLLGNAYTHTLQLDLYPIEISQEYITPGAIALEVRAMDGDTQVLKSFGQDQAICGEVANGYCVEVVRGNLPQVSAPQIARLYLDSPQLGKFGIYRIRWPFLASDGTWQLTSPDKMPGYSLDQFNHGWSSQEFELQIMTTLGFQYSPTDLFFEGADDLMQRLYNRLGQTTLGNYICSVESCQPGSALYESYSTPDSDRKFRALQTSFASQAQQLSDVPEVKNFMDSMNAQGEFILGSGENQSVYLMNKNQVLSKWDSDPRSRYVLRWALDAETTGLEFQALTQAWDWVWRERITMEQKAQDLCFPHGATTPVCNANSPEIQVLDTSHLDLALRNERTKLKALFQQEDTDAQNKVREFTTLSLNLYGTTYCDWNDPDTDCTTWDFLFSDHDMIEHFTSSPTDPEYKRYGFDSPDARLNQ